VLTDWTTDYQASQKDAPPFPDKEVIGGKHCIAPACLDMSLKHSLENMNLETIDLLYLHNVGEQQVKLIGFKEASERLRQAFIFLEKCRREGKIRYYGISSLTSFRVDPSDKTYMSLRDIEQIAREAGGKSHGLRFIQLPVTVTMPEATTLVHQSGVSAVAKARELGLHVMSGSSRGLYSKFAANNQALAAYKTCKSSLGVSEELDTKLSAAALSLHLTRSLSSLSTAITGMKQEHIEEHMAVLNMPKESPRMLQCVITATTNQHTESEKSANLLLDINSPLDVDATIHKIQDTFQDTISSVKGSIGELGHLGGMDGSMMQGGFAGVTNSISAGAKALYQKAVNFEEGLEHQIGAGHIMHDSLGSVQRGVDMVKASAQSLYNQAIATEHQIGETASVAGAELNELAHEKLAQAHNALEVIQQDVRQAPQFDQVVQDINNKVNTVRDTLSVDALERDMRAVAEGIEQHVSKFGKQGARHPNMSSELKAQMNQHSGFAQMLGMRDRDREGGGHEHSRTEQKMEELKEQRRQKRANLRRNGRAES
jgi:aryl-alcohol dehydrogenase-like predicted oxidoreductase